MRFRIRRACCEPTALRRYLGMGTSTFLRMVDEGVLPKPKRIRGVVAWDWFTLDTYVDAIGDDEANTVERIVRGG